jgi:hypothetical protein
VALVRRPTARTVQAQEVPLRARLELDLRPATRDPRPARDSQYATIDTQRSMANSSNSSDATKSWSELEQNLPDADLFCPEVFTLPDNKRRGPPPIKVFCRGFPNYPEAQKKYRVFRDAGKTDDEAFKSIQHLLETTKEGVMTRQEDKSFWVQKAQSHLKKLAGKKTYRETSSSTNRRRNFKMTSARAAGDQHTYSDLSFSRPSSSNIDDYAFLAETLSQNSTALDTRLKLIQHDPTKLASFLSTERTNSLSNVKSFLEALRNGRLRPIEDAEAEHWGDEVPKRFEVKDVCPDLDLQDVWGSAITNAKQGTVYEGHRSNDPLPFKPSFVSTFCRGISAGQPKFAVNIPLGDLTLHLPQHIEEQYSIYQQEGEDSVFLAQANIGTFGSVVDLHDGNTLSGISLEIN